MNSFQELILYTRNKEGRKEDGGKQSGRKGEEGGNNFFYIMQLRLQMLMKQKKIFK